MFFAELIMSMGDAWKELGLEYLTSGYIETTSYR